MRCEGYLARPFDKQRCNAIVKYRYGGRNTCEIHWEGNRMLRQVRRRLAWIIMRHHVLANLEEAIRRTARHVNVPVHQRYIPARNRQPLPPKCRAGRIAFSGTVIHALDCRETGLWWCVCQPYWREPSWKLEFVETRTYNCKSCMAQIARTEEEP